MDMVRADLGAVTSDLRSRVWLYVCARAPGRAPKAKRYTFAAPFGDGRRVGPAAPDLFTSFKSGGFFVLAARVDIAYGSLDS
jgi:hypothetical protein